MAAAFRPVNSPLSPEAAATNTRGDVMTPSPSTPRPSTAPHPEPAKHVDDGKTPTRATFSPVMAGQQPSSSSPFPQMPGTPGATDRSRHDPPRSDTSQQSVQPQRRDSMDVDMDESDGELHAAEDGAGSDDESVNADGSRSGKKKKSQRFYCTDYPPCNLSFTRSEHLARHIRKHTGERPFQCHCSRRFSRLDNLRQHAQTVHVNEDIPIDSLAATGSRFQRQMRTERVRAAGNRARASTGGSAGGPPRGHSKSLSTSSINSISSVGSSYGAPTETRRRPPPLVMADPRPRPIDPYRPNADAGYQHRPPSPDFSTPTSATFSTGQSSPRWSGMASPTTSHSRSHSLYSSGPRTPGRRLSVPSAGNPMQYSQVPGRVVFGGAGPMNSSNSGAFPPSTNGFTTSPAMSNAPGTPDRRDSTSSAADDSWRRRTWHHPDSRGYVQSQLSNVANQSSMGPNPPPPIANPSNSKSTLQLPGIESFDQPHSHGPLTPPGRQSSPMMVDPQSRPPVPQPGQRDAGAPEDRRNLNVYDASLQRGLTRLDISHNTPHGDGAAAWAADVQRVALAQAEATRANPPVRFDGQQATPPAYLVSGGTVRGAASLHQHTMSAPSIATPRENKRQGWYNGPRRTDHEEMRQSYQDPRSSRVDRMIHPNVTGFSGFPAREQHAPPQHQPPQQHQHQQERSANGESLGRLEALVAVATSEGSTATAY